MYQVQSTTYPGQLDPLEQKMNPGKPQNQFAQGYPIQAMQMQAQMPKGVDNNDPYLNQMRCIGKTKSTIVTCTHCDNKTATRTKCSCGSKMMMCCLVFSAPILIGCIPCCCIPFLIPSWYEYKHYWGDCNTYIGKADTGGMN